MPSNATGWLTRFAPIWFGQALSLVGSNIASFGIIWWLTATTGSTQVLASATLATFIPMIVLRPLAGVLVDRWSRKWIIVIADAAIGIASLWLAWMFWRGSMELWHVYVVASVRSVGEAFHVPAMTAATSLLVPEKHLSRLAGANHLLNGGLKLAGPVIGALAISALPLHGVMLIDALTAVLAIVPVLVLSIPSPLRTDSVKHEPVWRNLGSALRYLREAPGFLVLFGFFALGNAFGALIGPYFPLYITDFFQGGAFHLAAIQSGWGVGCILGGLVFMAWSGFRSKPTTILLAASLESLGGLLVAFSPPDTIVFAVAGMAIVGFMSSYVNAPLTPLIQANVPHEMQGRIIALNTTFAYVLYPLGVILGAILVERYGVRVILQIFRCLFLGTALLALLPVVRNLESKLESMRN